MVNPKPPYPCPASAEFVLQANNITAANATALNFNVRRLILFMIALLLQVFEAAGSRTASLLKENATTMPNL